MKEKLGFWAFALGIVGTGFGMGGVENAQTASEWIAVAGVTFTSLLLMQMGIWMIKDEV